MADDEGYATDVGGDNRNATRQRLQYRIRHVIDKTGVDGYIRISIRFRHFFPVKPTGKKHSSGQSFALDKCLE